ncbi:hypothetical protein C0991_006041 [Blastosporella zonata]|nr:hypothetical protein C0991_006041 [Blastosporella zonata]
MESFYLVTDPLSRPRIVGFLDTLAALSVISKLEGNMDCRVLHISDYELDDRQQEVVVFYEKTTSGFTSTLVNKLLSLNSNDDWFLLHLDDSMAVLDEVGTCASDLLWRRTLKESGDISSDEGNIGNDISTREQIRLRIKNWNFSLPNIDPTSFHFNVTHKFMMLVKVLESCEPYGEAFNKECLNFGENNGRAQTTIHMVQNNAETHETTQLSDRTPKTLTIERADNIGPSTVIRDPTTGNCLYTRDSVVAVERIASCGRLNGVLLDQVLFSFKKEEDASASGRSFRCCVTISGLVELTGPPRQTKLDAQSVACFIFCQHLASTGLLDCRFFPPPKSLDTARLGSGHQPSPKDPNSGGPRRYSRKEPEFWPNTRKFESASLYPIIISTPPDPDKQPYAPIVILTRQPLPDLASFNIFHSGIPAVVSIERGEPLPIDGAQLNDLYLYTLRICRTVSNKPFQCSQADMAYFFAPLTTTWTSSGQCDPASPLNLPSIVSHIPWDAVQLAGSSYNMPIKMDTLEDADRDVHDAVIQDRQVEFTRRYDAVKLRPDLSPLSKPKDSRREAAFENMLEFTKARRKGFEELKDVNQPLIEVITIPGVLNQLNPLSRPLPIAKSSHAKYVLLHMSLCTPSSGAEYNYERLELLGDAFLKYMSSTYLFVTHPAHKEGSLHDERQGLISNKSLYRCADRAGVPNYIQSKLFSPRVWAPPFFTVPAPVNKANDDAAVDQAIADVAEAILAAGYLTGGRETALQVAKALGIPILGVNTWSDFAAKGIVAPLNLNLKQDSIEPVESIIGYKVKQPQLLSQALTHFSIVGHDSTFTERLEFVGDAILDFMVIRHLYEKEQQLTPGGLTLLKAAMVSNSTLAAVCVCSGLYEHFCHKSHPLHTSIRDYVSRLEMCREKEYKDAESEGRPPGQFWLDITAPKPEDTITPSNNATV